MHGYDDGQIDAVPKRRRARRLSELFAQMARDADGPVSVVTIRDALGDRSLAALLVLFSAFNLLPLPPGATAITGVPLIIFSSQLIWGNRRAWLPNFLKNRSISPDQFRRSMEWIIPRLIRIEKAIKPRYWPFWRRRGDRIIGIMALILAIVVTLPIPLGNWLPALSTALLGLSLVERDGILLAIGGAVGVASMAIIVFLLGAFGLAAEAAYGWLF
jgi:hypothetical protein